MGGEIFTAILGEVPKKPGPPAKSFAPERNTPATVAPTELDVEDHSDAIAAAVDRIRVLRTKFERPEGGLRLRIIAGGCSGMQYRIDFAETSRATDLIVEAGDVKVFIDPKSLTYVKGSSLDYWEDLLGGGFKVVNPNAKSACSCGVSFTV